MKFASPKVLQCRIRYSPRHLEILLYYRSLITELKCLGGLIRTSILISLSRQARVGNFGFNLATSSFMIFMEKIVLQSTSHQIVFSHLRFLRSPTISLDELFCSSPQFPVPRLHVFVNQCLDGWHDPCHRNRLSTKMSSILTTTPTVSLGTSLETLSTSVYPIHRPNHTLFHPM